MSEVAGSGAAASTQVAPAYAGGAAYFELGPLPDSEAVLTTLVEVLVEGWRPGQDKLVALERYYRGREALLVLDGCETHRSTCRRLAERLLRSSARLRILATSREALGPSAERSLRLNPLDLPPDSVQSLAELRTYAASRLFLEYAADRGFEARPADVSSIVSLCHMLAGMPLALELAAAWTRSLSVQTLQHRFPKTGIRIYDPGRDESDPHRSLWSALQLSWDLLSEREQRFLCFASLFSEGMPERVVPEPKDCVKDPAKWDNSERQRELEACDRLVASSLLRIRREHGSGIRYTMLDPVREYCTEMLRTPAREGILWAFGRYYFSYVIRLQGRLGMDVIGTPSEAPSADLRRAVHLAAPGEALQILDTGFEYWLRCGLDDYTDLVSSVLARAERREDLLPPAGPAIALWSLRSLLLGGYRGRYAMDVLAAISILEPEAAKLMEPEWNRTELWVTMAYVAEAIGAREKARELYYAALRTARERRGSLAQAVAVGDLLAWVGEMEFALGNYPVAQERFEESLGVYPNAHAAIGLARMAFRAGNRERGLGFLAEARRLAPHALRNWTYAQGDDYVERTLGRVARLYQSVGESAAAEGCLRDSAKLADTTHRVWIMADLAVRLAGLALEREDLRSAELLYGAAHWGDASGYVWELDRESRGSKLGGRWAECMSKEQAVFGLERLFELLRTRDDLSLDRVVELAFAG